MGNDDSEDRVEDQPAKDPVRELLGNPLTPEQREQKRKELLQRQKEAREKASQQTHDNAPSLAPVASATPSAPVTTPVEQPVREDLLRQAVSFLTSPNVQTAEMSKKLDFLRKKGLNDKEIEVALERSKNGSTVLTAAPPVPSRPPSTAQAQQQPQVMYIMEPRPPRAHLQQIVGWAILAGLGTAGLGACVLALIKAVVKPVFAGFSSHRASLYGYRAQIMQRLVKILHALNAKYAIKAAEPVEDKEQQPPVEIAQVESERNKDLAFVSTGTEDALNNIAEIQEKTKRNLDRLENQARLYLNSIARPQDFASGDLDDLDQLLDAPKPTRFISYSDKSSYSDLQASIESLKAFIYTNMHTTPISYSNPYGGPFHSPSIPMSTASAFSDVDTNALRNLKSDIRGLKGALLSRRNFPMVAGR